MTTQLTHAMAKDTLCSDASLAVAGKIAFFHGTKGKARAEAVQTLLNDFGYGIEIDGKFGYKSQAALCKFQYDRGLKITGVCDHKTLETLLNPDAARYDFPKNATLKERVFIEGSRFLGVTETAQNSGVAVGMMQHTPNGNKAMWCTSATVTWLNNAAKNDQGILLVTPTASTCALQKDFREHGAYHKAYDWKKRTHAYMPQKGDVIFVDNAREGTYNHSGIVATVEQRDGKTYITTIEGNVSGGVGGHDHVATRRYVQTPHGWVGEKDKTARIVGFGDTEIMKKAKGIPDPSPAYAPVTISLAESLTPSILTVSDSTRVVPKPSFVK